MVFNVASTDSDITFDDLQLHNITADQFNDYRDNNLPEEGELVRREEPEEEEPIRERIVLEEEREPVIKLPPSLGDEEADREEEPVIRQQIKTGRASL